MAEVGKPVITNTLQYVFTTDQDDVTIAKSFSDYDTTITDDTIKTVGDAFVAQKVFASDDDAVITGILTANRREVKNTLTIDNRPKDDAQAGA